MTDILTITLNPAVDVATTTDRLVPAHKLRCAAPRRFAGGGGINVARVIHRLGGKVQALYLGGGLNGQQLAQLLAAEAVPARCLSVLGETRESFSVLETSAGNEYRFVMPGPTVLEQEWLTCVEAVRSLQPVPRFVVFSGSLPPGVPIDAYSQLARLAAARGSRVALDTSGPALTAALHGKSVEVLKPSLRELSEHVGRPLQDETQWRAAAGQVITQGQARVIALSLGEGGALLVTADGSWRADALPMQVLNTTGAGDSFMAGLVLGIANGMALVEAFRQAVATASATLLYEGTALCQREDVRRLLPDVHLRAI